MTLNNLALKIAFSPPKTGVNGVAQLEAPEK
jgi:hypothetical protein